MFVSTLFFHYFYSLLKIIVIEFGNHVLNNQILFDLGQPFPNDAATDGTNT